MNVAIEELGACQKKLTISLSPEEVNKEFQSVIQDIRKKAMVPGFRKGKASVSTIKRRFGKEIAQDVKEKLIETSFKDALVEHHISPIGTPTIDYKNIKVAENQPVEYVAEIEAFPAVELKDYKGVEITRKRPPEPTAEEIQYQLVALQRQNAINEPVNEDHVIVENNNVTVAFQRFLDGQPLEESKQQASFWLGVDNLFPEFSQNLFGKKKGDREIQFSLTYPQDFQDQSIAGKTVQFVLDILNVENVVLPELDDEFAKDLEEESLDALKAKIARQITEQRERVIVAETKNRILMQLAEMYDFEVPPSLVKDQKKHFPDQEEAELLKRLRAGILLNHIQEQENITVSEAEVDEAVEAMATQHQMPVAAMKSYLEQHNGLDQVRTDLKESKTLDFLYEQAHVVEEA
ncbi:trigger factor [Candidatus Vecturithrix granuli]|uniref:Trigger factor n=1 Tax=Vecturithrix granuli TaxID=1499967 RepID=A0A081C750_VECG1|nr:trigger factor [Candidatus Vecturithrix granuli]